MNQLFMGEYEHSLDAKGRLIVPARFREEGGDKFVVTNGLDGCLFVFTEEKWEAVVESISRMPLTSKDARRFSRFMLGGAAPCEVDKQGRILIPANLRSRAGLTRDVILLGVGTRIEIWDKEKWENSDNFDDIEDLAEGLEELRF